MNVVNDGLPAIWVFIAFYVGIYYGREGFKGALWAFCRAIGYIFLFVLLAFIFSMIIFFLIDKFN